jgi:hypothetical protein
MGMPRATAVSQFAAVARQQDGAALATGGVGQQVTQHAG